MSTGEVGCRDRIIGLVIGNQVIGHFVNCIGFGRSGHSTDFFGRFFISFLSFLGRFGGFSTISRAFFFISSTFFPISRAVFT